MEQNRANTVFELVIKPLEAMYGKEYDEHSQSAIIEDLGKFSDSVLKEAVAQVRRTQKYLPRLAHLFEACRDATDAGSLTNTADSHWPWVQREKRRKELVDGYLKGFRASSLYGQSVREGWDIPLIRFAAAVASVQVQYLVPGGSGIGWSQVDIFGPCEMAKGELERFLEDCQRQASMGYLNVTVPTERIDEMKAWAQRFTPQVA